MPPPTADHVHCSLSAFHRMSEADVRHLIMSSAIKSSTLDPVPTFLLCEFVDVLLPYVTCMVTSSLHQGRLPDSQKHAVVTPLLKRPGLDTADMANYRPVSNVTFMSKIVERAVSSSNFTSTSPTMISYHATSLHTAVTTRQKRPCCVCFLIF